MVFRQLHPQTEPIILKVISSLQEVEREISFRTESGLGRILQLVLLDSDLDNFMLIH